MEHPSSFVLLHFRGERRRASDVDSSTRTHFSRPKRAYFAVSRAKVDAGLHHKHHTSPVPHRLPILWRSEPCAEGEQAPHGSRIRKEDKRPRGHMCIVCAGTRLKFLPLRAENSFCTQGSREIAIVDLDRGRREARREAVCIRDFTCWNIHLPHGPRTSRFPFLRHPPQPRVSTDNLAQL